MAPERQNSYGSEGEFVVDRKDRRAIHECPLRDKIARGQDPFQKSNWTSIAGLVIQTLVLLGSLLGFVRYIEKRLDILDSHAKASVTNLVNHLNYDHYEKDKTRMMMHNTCKDAMDKGCHPSVILKPPNIMIPQVAPSHSGP